MRKKVVSGLALAILLSNLSNDQTYAETNNVVNSDEQVTNIQIEEAKKELEDLTIEKSITEEEKVNLDLSLLQLEEEKQKLVNKLNYLLEHLDKKELEVIKLNEDLSDLKNGLEETKIALLDREEEFKGRLNTLYKEHMTSDTKVIEVILNSDGFLDLINNLSSYQKIVGSDNDKVLKYIELINKLETDTKATESVILEISKKINEVKELLEDVEETIKEKVEIEYLLNQKIKEKDVKLNEININLTSKEEEINLLIETEKLRIEEEKLNKERLKKEVSAQKSKDSVSITQLNELSFEGDEEFLTYQKSINFMRTQVSKEDLDKYYVLIEKYAKQRGIPTALVKGIIMTESTFKRDTTNVNNNGTVDRGLMQMNSNTAPSVAKDLGLTYEVGMEFIPDTNINMGTYYISRHYNEDDIHKGLSTYNRGPNGVKKWYSNNGSYVTPYSKKVVGYMKVFLEEEKK